MVSSVKFVSRINGSFPPKKIMGQFFFSEKRENQGGGYVVFLSKGHNFTVFLAPFPN